MQDSGIYVNGYTSLKKSPSKSCEMIVNANVNEFQCKDDREGLKNYGVVKNSSSVLLYGRDGTKNLEENCKIEVSIPVSESTLHTLRLDNPKKSLEQGFNLEIKQDCSVCLESKGACGYNHISSGFVCYCDDATHGQNCGSGRRSKERITSKTTESDVPHSTQTLHLCTGEKNYKVICRSGRERRIWNCL
ncbi:hypothetical protein YC2023_015945 [Brassica napus]